MDDQLNIKNILGIRSLKNQETRIHLVFGILECTIGIRNHKLDLLVRDGDQEGVRYTVVGLTPCLYRNPE